MKILATVLLGPGAEQSVPDAVASVREFVDGFILIESCGGQMAVAAAEKAAGDRYYWSTRYTWQRDYGKARQFALDAARMSCADYALTLDPDERVELHPSFREKLDAFPAIDVWNVRDRDEGYYKERIIRCASDARWHGTVCENVDLASERARIDGHFWELPKTPEQLQARYERGVIETARMIAAGDDRYKWHRHRGTCLMGLGRKDEGLAEYRIALSKADCAEDRAWCSYLICEQLVLRDEWTLARELAAQGLADHAGFLPEFGWIIAYVDFKRGQAAGATTEAALSTGNAATDPGLALLQNASRWAQICLNMPQDRTRVSFRGKQYLRGCREILAVVHAKATPAPEGKAA